MTDQDESLSKIDAMLRTAYAVANDTVAAYIKEARALLAATAEIERMRSLTYQDALIIARGCTDYSGGYGGNDELFEAYQNGVKTVISALEAGEKRGMNDAQVAALHRMGKRPL